MAGPAFLGVGWAFPVELENGRVKLAEYEASVHQAIWIILGTAPGERVMRPDFGCGIHNLVFGLSNDTTAGLIAYEVRQALLRWEPRVDVLDVRVTPDDTGQQLLVDIDYQIRAANSRYNLVYPFYLERGTQ
jgi:phage baseplate assembly protein W